MMVYHRIPILNVKIDFFKFSVTKFIKTTTTI